MFIEKGVVKIPLGKCFSMVEKMRDVAEINFGNLDAIFILVSFVRIFIWWAWVFCFPYPVSGIVVLFVALLHFVVRVEGCYMAIRVSVIGMLCIVIFVVVFVYLFCLTRLSIIVVQALSVSSTIKGTVRPKFTSGVYSWTSKQTAETKSAPQLFMYATMPIHIMSSTMSIVS